MAFQLDLDCTDFDTNGDQRNAWGKFYLVGDFDIQVDWFAQGTANRHHNVLRFYVEAQGGGWQYHSHYHHDTVNLPHTYRFYRNPGVTMAVVGSNVLGGTWRIQRVGSNSTLSYIDANNPTWTGFYTSGLGTGDARIQFASYFSKADGITDPSPTPCTMRFDNFVVNSADNVIWP